jgi:serine/threonine-protein kinase RsbW
MVDGPMGDRLYEIEIPSTLEHLGEAQQGALAALLEHDWIESDQVFYAQLCLEEALVNAITHGNKSDKHRKVRLEMEEVGDHLAIRVFDEGEGFSAENVQLPATDKLNGRGVCLIRYCMENVTYNQDGKYLEMIMRRKCLAEGDPSDE